MTYSSCTFLNITAPVESDEPLDDPAAATDALDATVATVTAAMVEAMSGLLGWSVHDVVALGEPESDAAIAVVATVEHATAESTEAAARSALEAQVVDDVDALAAHDAIEAVSIESQTVDAVDSHPVADTAWA